MCLCICGNTCSMYGDKVRLKSAKTQKRTLQERIQERTHACAHAAALRLLCCYTCSVFACLPLRQLADACAPAAAHASCLLCFNSLEAPLESGHVPVHMHWHTHSVCSSSARIAGMCSRTCNHIAVAHKLSALLPLEELAQRACAHAAAYTQSVRLAIAQRADRCSCTCSGIQACPLCFCSKSRLELMQRHTECVRVLSHLHCQCRRADTPSSGPFFGPAICLS
jgi:hypothetical protein